MIGINYILWSLNKYVCIPYLRIPLPYLLFIHDEILSNKLNLKQAEISIFKKTEWKLIAKTIKNDRENKNSKSSFFGNFSKLDNPLAKLAKKKLNIQIMRIKNERIS